MIKNLVFLVFLFFKCSTSAWAAEHVVERAYVKDPTGMWALEQAQAQTLKPFSGALTKGYGSGAIWVRLRIDPSLSAAKPNDDLYLRIRPVYLDDLQIYDEIDDYVPRPTMGDRHPLQAQDEQATFYLLRLKAGQTPRDVWVRIQTTSTRLAFFEVLDEASLRNSNQKIQTFGGIFLAFVGVFTVMGLWQALARQDGLNWSFTFYQLMSLFYGAVILGYMRVWTDGWLPPVVVDRMFSFLGLFFVYGIALYSHFLARELGPSKTRNIFFYGASALFVVALCLHLLNEVRLSLQVNMVLSLAIPTFFFLNTVFCKTKPGGSNESPQLKKQYVVLYFGLTLVFAYFLVLPSIGVIKAVEFTIYSVLFYILSSGALMLLMLQYRAHFFQRQQEALLNDAQIAKQLAEVERARRMERERLLAMLGHEIKTPLATLRMMLGDNDLPQKATRQMIEPLQEINELIERTVQTGQLENEAIPLRPQLGKLLNALEQPILKMPSSKRLQWKPDPRAAEVEVWTDPFLLSIVVRNLLDNAVKYSPEGSPIKANLHVDPERAVWVFEVHNMVGRAGFPDAEHVFEKFWRSPKASYRSGSGQGLYIASRLAHLMGGSLAYMPSSDSICFKLEVPFRPPGQDSHAVE